MGSDSRKSRPIIVGDRRHKLRETQFQTYNWPLSHTTIVPIAERFIPPI
jgi:hypothetical protein